MNQSWTNIAIWPGFNHGPILTSDLGATVQPSKRQCFANRMCVWGVLTQYHTEIYRTKIFKNAKYRKINKLHFKKYNRKGIDIDYDVLYLGLMVSNKNNFWLLRKNL